MNKESTVVQLHQNPLLSAALAYVSIGWHILPCWWIEKNEEGKHHCACGNEACASPGKHPLQKLVPWGQTSATTDPELVKSWWERFPKANIAVFLAPSGLCAIDIDPRNGGIDTIDDVEAKHGALVSDLLQFSGGGGEHRIFLKPGDNQTLPGKLGAGVDVKLNGYIMLEPSNHVSGGSYMFEASSDPRDGIMASPLPDWLRDLSGHKVVSSTAAGRVIPVSEEQRAEIIEAMCAIPADDRDTWLQVGMALQSTGDAQWAFSTWDSWSAQSNKYNQVDQIRVWRSFKSKGLDGITYKTIFGMAKALGTVVRPAFQSVSVGSVNLVQSTQEAAPEILLNPPGILGAVVEWINATSRKPQPMFAMQAAIAFGSTVIGRRFVSTNDNWPSLYLLNIGKSASGKEHAKWAIETLLEACDLGSLIGPASYTSNSGVLSALHDQPCHITIVDEFGKELEQASIKNNARAQGMLKSLIEVWGRCDGVVRPQGYSTFGMSASDAAKMKDRFIRNPALTLLGITTPDTFFESIGSAAARDGFLNRFLIVESEIGRQTSSLAQKKPVPQDVIDWAKAVCAMSNGQVNQVSNPSLDPAAVSVDISRAALEMFTAFDAECIGLMNQYDQCGLSEMFGRTNEIAMRLALIAAVSRLEGDQMTIEGTDAAWAISYARFHAKRTVERLKTSMFDSEFEAAKQQVIHLLVQHGQRGLTISEINKVSRKFRAMNKRQQIELMESLRFVGLAQLVSIPPQSGRGQTRDAWVATEPEIDSDLIGGDKNVGYIPPGNNKD